MATYRASVLFRLLSDPPVYLWSGYGPLETAADALDAGGASWRGAAELVSVPTLKQLINGEADRIEVKVSGVSPHTLRLAHEDRASVKGAAANIGIIEFDDAWQQQGPIKWHWSGLGGVIITESVASENGRDWSVTLSMASADTYLSNPRLSFFTAADQAKRSPTDQFFSHVAGISAGTTRRFGPL
ncbi:hypothetical protein WG907_04330 [Sphingobium sp. AN558]|uniref:hypothetical protein n=1 Tax=Sphingobium sp. AN558 TaxID=3133442 RepID=UPI0030BDF375